jgi:hypothetical protein
MDKQWETSGLSDNNLHSSREERHTLGGTNQPKVKKGFFQNNPSFKIIMIDLLLIVIISGVFVPFIMKREGTSRIDNYKLTLKAFNFDDQVMATLVILNTEDLDNEGLVEASFYIDENINLYLESDILPSRLEERILKTKLKSENSDYLYCKIEINGKTKTIKKRIQ